MLYRLLKADAANRWAGTDAGLGNSSLWLQEGKDKLKKKKNTVSDSTEASYSIILNGHTTTENSLRGAGISEKCPTLGEKESEIFLFLSDVNLISI